SDRRARRCARLRRSGNLAAEEREGGTGGRAESGRQRSWGPTWMATLSGRLPGRLLGGGGGSPRSGDPGIQEGLARGFQDDPLLHRRFHGFARERHGMVAALGPVLQQIAVMFAGGI